MKHISVVFLRILIITSTLVLMSAERMTAQRTLSLSGSWDFLMGDPPGYAADSLPPAAYADYVLLPGSMLTNGKGHRVSVSTPWTGSLYDSSYYFNPYMAKYRQEQGVMKFPFFLTPERHYVGAAWYRKKIYVPQDWDEQLMTLFLERPHIETTVYVNGVKMGHNMSLSVPHRYDVSRAMVAGRTNEIAVRVYNGTENVCVGQDSHSVSDQTQGNWNGLTGRLELQGQWKKLYVKGATVTTDTVVQKVGRKRRRVPVTTVTVHLGNHLSRVLPLWDYFVTLTIRKVVKGVVVEKPVVSTKLDVKGKDEVTFNLYQHKNLKRWDEFHPNLYEMTIEAGEDIYVRRFGVRTIEASGRHLLINGRELLLRGTVGSCCFPETGYPPTDEEQWVAIFQKCKDYGLNHMRFHSYCPPEAAFAAADRVGFYLQVEGPSWPNHGVRLRRGQPIDEYLLEESKRIVDAYGHHPSFVMMAAGNEPAGDWVSYCNDWVSEMHRYDPTRLYCGASVGGGWAWDNGSEFHVKGGARGLDWDRHAPHSDDDYYSQIEFPRNYHDSTANHTPVIAHEQGQWCAFPDLDETWQYGGAYKARNFEIFSDLLRDNGMASQARNFLMASGKLQTLCYKYEIERNLRTRDYAGFQLLGLNDYSGQGTALVGVLNVHWKEKRYTDQSKWREFCGPLVPLARFPRFVYASSDTLRVPVEIYNATYANIKNVPVTYTITDDSLQQVAGGTLVANHLLPIGKNIAAGTVVQPLAAISQPRKLTLTVSLGEHFSNSWDFWVYPEHDGDDGSDGSGASNGSSGAGSGSSGAGKIGGASSGSSKTKVGYGGSGASNGSSKTKVGHGGRKPATIVETSDYREALAALQRGATVLLTAAGRVTLGSDVKQSYLPVFWNTSWFKMRPPHTTGAYIDKHHPLFRHGFPTDDWSNLNWWELLNNAQVMNLMELPADYQPPIQPIDTWHVSRKLAMMVEARVGKGRLLMTTMDISSDLDHRLVARQMRKAIRRYMQSDDFQPLITMSAEVMEHFFTKHAQPVDMYTKDSPDELKPKLK